LSRRDGGESGQRLPDEARADPAAGRRLQAAGRAAHECRQRGSQPPGGARAQRLPGEGFVSKPAGLYNRLALIGTGLIGSSIARAARAQGVVREIVATAPSAATRRRVAELGLAAQVAETNAAAVAGADLVIVCVPVGMCGVVAAEIGPHLASGATVSDVGSVEAAVVRDMA